MRSKLKNSWKVTSNKTNSSLIWLDWMTQTAATPAPSTVKKWTYSISILRSSTAEENTPWWYKRTTFSLHFSRHSESDWHSSQHPWQIYKSPRRAVNLSSLENNKNNKYRPILNNIRQVCISLDNFRPIWTSLDQCEQV